MLPRASLTIGSLAAIDNPLLVLLCFSLSDVYPTHTTKLSVNRTTLRSLSMILLIVCLPYLAVSLRRFSLLQYVSLAVDK